MALDFDGVDDVAVATITAIDSGDWTIGVWVNPRTAGEGGAARMVSIDTTAGANRQLLRVNSNRHPQVIQGFAVLSASALSNAPLPANEWTLVFGRLVGSALSIFTGTQSTAVAEVGYSSNAAGTGSRLTGATQARLGNSPAGDATWDGQETRPFVWAKALTLAEMEAFRTGTEPAQDGTLTAYWPLDEGTGSTANDTSGNGAHATITGALWTADPFASPQSVALNTLTMATAPQPLGATPAPATATASSLVLDLTPQSLSVLAAPSSAPVASLALVLAPSTLAPSSPSAAALASLALVLTPQALGASVGAAPPVVALQTLTLALAAHPLAPAGAPTTAALPTLGLVLSPSSLVAMPPPSSLAVSSLTLALAIQSLGASVGVPPPVVALSSLVLSLAPQPVGTLAAPAGAGLSSLVLVFSAGSLTVGVVTLPGYVTVGVVAAGATVGLSAAGASDGVGSAGSDVEMYAADVAVDVVST